MELAPPRVLALLNRLRGRHLAMIVALEEEGSLHKAARVVSISQPAATKMLREIESAFGVQLFERLSRSTVPTELGRQVAAFARLAIVDLRHLHDDLETVRSGGRGHVRVGAIMAAVPTLVAGAMARLRRRHPGITVDLRVDTSDLLVRDLLSGDLDLVLGRLASDPERAAIGWEAVGDERATIVCGPRNELAKRPRLTLPALGDRAWILQSHPSPMRQLIEREFSRARLKPPTVAAQTPSFLATVAMLQHTDLLAVWPDTVAADFERQGKVRSLPLTLKGRLPPYGILTLKGRPASTPIRIFVDALRAAGEKS